MCTGNQAFVPQYTIPREPQPQKRKRKQSGTVLLSPNRQKVDGKRKTDKPVAPPPPAKKKYPPCKVVSKPSPQPRNKKSGDKEVVIDSDLFLLSPDVLLSPKRQMGRGRQTNQWHPRHRQRRNVHLVKLCHNPQHNLAKRRVDTSMIMRNMFR